MLQKCYNEMIAQALNFDNFIFDIHHSAYVSTITGIALLVYFYVSFPPLTINKQFRQVIGGITLSCNRPSLNSYIKYEHFVMAIFFKNIYILFISQFLKFRVQKVAIIHTTTDQILEIAAYNINITDRYSKFMNDLSFWGIR